jgi:hypothetical protein
MGNEHAYPARTSFLLHGTHSTLPHEICQNAYQLRALCQPYGSPYHWTNNFKLQKTYAQSGNQGLANSIWQDFGGMTQGDNKTGQKGTHAMCVMTHDKNAHAHAAQFFFTYSNPVVDYCPQKEFPH